MKVMLLAAGIGERMRPLTDHTPKPMLRVQGIPLLEHHVRRLVDAGFTDLVINVSHLAQQIVDYFADGSRWGAKIVWSRETQPLETAGGIINALPLLGEAPFMVVNGDIWTDYPFARLSDVSPESNEGAHLVMVDNPPQHPCGDFVLGTQGQLNSRLPDESGLTYAGVGVYTRGFLSGVPVGALPLRPLLDRAIERQCLYGEYYSGEWVDVGTPERLSQLNTETA